MTTLADRGGIPVTRVNCAPPPGRDVHLPLELALRDMRTANGRDENTGERPGNSSWIGVCLGMIVLDTLSGTSRPVWTRFKNLLTAHEVEPEDADIVWGVRNALLHGYGVPKPDDAADRNVVFTDDTTAYALDTSHPGVALLSVPVFCSHLVERIAAAVPEQWDPSLISVSGDLLRIGRIHLLPPSQPGRSSS
jgi:hypothetical protein